MTGALPLIDTHAHVQFDAFDGDRAAALARAREAGLRAIVVVGTDVPSSEAAIALAQEHDWLYATAGIHPHEAASIRPSDINRLRALAAGGRVVAVGETGLDYYHMLSPREAQVALFRAHLDLAAELGLPAVVHSRDAADDTWSMLSEWARRLPARHRGGRGAGVMHCFDGDLAAAERYVELGFVISIPGPVTYPNAARRREVARGLPLEALVLETDCPYLAPQGHRGQRNEPAYVAETARFIAELRGEPPERVAAATTANAARLFALPVDVAAPAGSKEHRS